MKFKTLAGITGVLIALALAVLALRQFTGTGPTEGRVGKPLLQTMDTERAARITIRSHEGEVTLNRKGGAEWTVEEQGGFPVDAKDLRQLLVRLSERQVAHQVTGKQDKLAGLSLLTAEENGGKWEKDKTGVQLEILDGQGGRLFGLLIGRDRRGGTNTGFGGTYVRFVGEPNAYLISDSVLRDYRSEDWIDKEVLNEDGAKTVKAIHIRKGRKDAVRLERDKPEDEWRMQGLAAGTLKQSEVKSLANLVAGLEISRVASPDKSPAELGRARTAQVEVEFFDRRKILIDIGEKKAGDDYRYLTLSAGLPGTVADDTLQDKVRQFNARFKGRLLGIYDWDGGRLLQNRKDFLEQPAKGKKKS